MHKSPVTKKLICIYVTCSVVLAWCVNRLVGLYMLLSLSGMPCSATDVCKSFGRTFFSHPVFTDKHATFVCALVCALAFLFFMLHFDITGQALMKKRVQGKEYGCAHWASLAEMKPFASSDEFRNVILSKSARLSLDRIADRRYERNKHILVLGGSGAGKSYNFLKPNLLQMFGSYVITDPKGELLADTGGFLLAHGYKILVLNTDDPTRSMHFNPFTMIKTEADILRQAGCIINNTQPPDGHKDFWVQAEQLLYEFCIGYMWMFAPKELCNIDTFLRLVGFAQIEEENEKAVSPLDILVRDLERKYTNKDREYFLVELWHGFKKGAGKTLKSILISCEVRLAPFKIPQVREMMRYDDTGDLSCIAQTPDTKAALFITMSAGDNTYRFLTSMIFFRVFDDLLHFARAQDNKRLPVRVWCGMDEFANIGRIPDIERHIAYLRSFGIDIIPILQSDAQIDAVYDEKIRKIIKGNCDTTLFLGRCDHDANSAFSDTLGEETICVDNVSRSRGSSDSYSVSEQKLARKLMAASDLGDDNFPGDECIVKIKQAAAFKDYKYDIKEHPYYSELERSTFNLDEYVLTQRARAAKNRMVDSYTARGIDMPEQDFFADVGEVIVMGE